MASTNGNSDCDDSEYAPWLLGLTGDVLITSQMCTQTYIKTDMQMWQQERPHQSGPGECTLIFTHTSISLKVFIYFGRFHIFDAEKFRAYVKQATTFACEQFLWKRVRNAVLTPRDE